MKDLMLGFKLIRYGYKCKTNVMMLILFTVLGVIVEISSRGTNIIGGYYFMLTGMFAYQMIVYMNASDYVQSSAMKRKLTTGMPVLVSTLVYLVMFTIVVTEKYVLTRVYPGNEEDYMNTLIMIMILLFFAMIFCGVCYKYFLVSFVAFMALIMYCMTVLNTRVYVDNILELANMSFGKLAGVGYVLIIAGGVIEYLLSLMLYKKPLSEYAMGGLLKSMK